MSTSAKDIVEELARARGFFHRHEILRAMVSVAQALKAMHAAPLFGHDKSHVVGLLQEMVQNLNRTDEVRKYRPNGLGYARGQEKKLLSELIFLLKKIKEEQARETPEQIRARKLRLDRAIIRGQRLLGVGKIKDGLTMFQEALKNYVDEHMVFFHIANKLSAAEQHQAALKYLLLGTEKAPEEGLIFVAAARTLFKLGKPVQAEQYMRKGMELGQNGADVHTLMGLILEKLGRLDESMQQADKALDLDPLHKNATTLQTRLERAMQSA